MGALLAHHAFSRRQVYGLRTERNPVRDSRAGKRNSLCWRDGCAAAAARTIASCADSSAPRGDCLRVSPSLAAPPALQEMRPVSGALASKGRCVTGIKRADTASEIQDRAGASKEVFGECLGALRARWSFNECSILAVDNLTDGSRGKFRPLTPGDMRPLLAALTASAQSNTRFWL